MKITYDEISTESKIIVNAMSSSNKVVPSALYPLKRVSMHFMLFLMLSLINYVVFSQEHEDGGGIWFLFFGFGVLNWFFLFAFVYGYEVLFAMIDEERVRNLKIVKLIRRKIRSYGLVWAAIIVLLGVGGAATEFNVALLVIGNFVGSVFLIFIFNMDMSRYQVSAIMGAVSEIRDNLKG